MSDDCKCAGIEEFIRSDTGNEFSGVCLVCTLCGREFDVTDVSESDQVPSDEDRIRDALAEATAHPGRIVTR